MIKYLIDEQIPSNVNAWKNSSFLQVRDFKPGMGDNEIWEYARLNQLTIITKVGDFDVLFNNLPGPYPKMIKHTIANMVLKNLIQFLKKDWNAIALLSGQYRIVIANAEFIEVFD